MKSLTKANKVIFLTLMSAIIYFTMFSLAYAISGGPGKVVISVKPGDTYEGNVYIENKDAEPKIGVITQNDLFFNESNSLDYSTEPLLKGLLNWTTFSDLTEKKIESGERYQANYVVKIPQDADPGTYSTGFLLSSKSIEEATQTGSGVAVGGRILSQLYLTVEGEFNENLELVNFGINEENFLNGEIVFDLTIKNTGDVILQPYGNITIYDEKDQQIKEVYAVTKQFENEEVVTDRKDEIPVGGSGVTLAPGATSKIATPWTHRKVELGTYKAKIVVYYGEGKKELIAETKVTLKENFSISEFKSESSYNSSLPVKFSAKLLNIGTLPVTPKGYFAVTNIFGSQKIRTDFTPEELNMKGGEEKVLNNIIWDNGFALGIYTASLHLDVNGKIFDKSFIFWVISWWQIAIIIVVIAVLTFLIYKGITMYRKMKKKIKEIEKNKK
ncbi:hypothetical protein JW911_00415 [Candidatus Peregrinibacteria bacterium]|nr:hypothetical protein [Candidatus Peregrinibacteria bacterium]